MSTVPTLVTPERLVLLRVKLVAEANGAEATKSAMQTAAARANFPREIARIKIIPFFFRYICRSMSTMKANRLREAPTFSSRRVNYLEIGEEVRWFALPRRVQRLAQN